MSSSSSAVQKSVYGRTRLFVPEKSVLLRSVRASGTLARRADGVVYHRVADHARCADAACWHCCEHFDGRGDGSDPAVVFRAPKAYDRTRGQYYVYGKFCSAECTKAYAIEHSGFDRGHQLCLLSQMMREVYGIREPIVEAPPRVSLRRFGGPFERVQTPPRTLVRTIEPPFVSYCMLMEECAPDHTIAETAGSLLEVSEADLMDDTIETKREHGMYGEFLAQLQQQPPSSTPALSSSTSFPARPSPPPVAQQHQRAHGHRTMPSASSSSMSESPTRPPNPKPNTKPIPNPKPTPLPGAGGRKRKSAASPPPALDDDECDGALDPVGRVCLGSSVPDGQVAAAPAAASGTGGTRQGTLRRFTRPTPPPVPPPRTPSTELD